IRGIFPAFGRLGLNNPPAPAGGIRGIFPAFGRLGLNNPPAPAGGIRLNIICVDTNAADIALFLTSFLAAAAQLRQVALFLNSFLAAAAQPRQVALLFPRSLG
ncbi:MAG: hypothetical protein ACRENG_12070, partial [bacterium]